MTDSIDDDDVTRVNRKVPEDLNVQTQIREWMDDNAEYFPDSARDYLSDRISRRRGGDPGGIGEATPDPGSGIYYDPDAGAWRDPSGSFTEGPE